ncbi:MAG: imidazole glycerol phosphate synthase subunit HisH [Candidatus Omnitrophica bacterium]|nr:imidazole glycerol phosphate synthase subunit HisH [Candidatus Omnitrophota bacterium]
MIAIIDYGMGNIHSVQKALEYFGAQTLITTKPDELAACEKAVLPGVGAFSDAMMELTKQGLPAAVSAYVKNKRPLLGICLGMQLFFSESQEAPGVRGLKIFEGAVRRFDPATGVKIPHIGWNELRIERRDCPLLEGVPESSRVYFCHSYYPDNRKKQERAASCEYGIDFTSVVWRENVYGVQFHPEKSQSTGLRILKNFVTLC